MVNKTSLNKTSPSPEDAAMENYLIAYNALYCLYLHIASLRDKGVAGVSLFTKGMTDDFTDKFNAERYVFARNANQIG